MLIRKIYYFLSPPLRLFVRRMVFLPVDFISGIFHKRDKLIPPRGLIFTGGGDFAGQGDNMMASIMKLCDLKPDSHVLDIGCGIGRIARPMAGFLSNVGSYSGFDIVRDGIDWCAKAYSGYSNFHFRHIPLQNDLYNLSTQNKAADFSFPYPSGQFDLIVLTSVFTHMQEPDVQQYIKEIGRVLKKNKYCYCTFFIITTESEEFLRKSKNPFFRYRFDHYYLHDNSVKDANIAYKYEVIENMLFSSGLKIKSFHPGWWTGRRKDECENFQDAMIITTLNGD